MKMHFFKNFEFEFETTRLLWYTSSGGADYGEVASVSEKIKDGDYNSWYLEWKKFAEKLELRGEKFKLNESKGNAFLRASRYYQAAEFFLDPKDERKIEAYNKSVTLFYKGLSAKKIDYISTEIAYNGIPLRTLYFQTTKESKGTFFICGGFDALLEELYFTNVLATLASGYDVVLYEGPGQSTVIREYKRPFEADWNKVARAVVDYYSTKYELKMPKIGLGVSLGGLLLSRAASLDADLFEKIILFNYFPDMLESFKKSLPSFLHRYLYKGFPPALERICSTYIARTKFLNWQVEHAKWVFSAGTLNELLLICQNFSEAVAYNQLKTDCLVFVAKQDNYYDYQLGIRFFNQILSTNKKLILFDKNKFSSDLHCQNGAAYDANDQIFDWLS